LTSNALRDKASFANTSPIVVEPVSGLYPASQIGMTFIAD
jgi:hypothetical protein